MNIQENINAYIKGTLSEEEIERLWVEFAKNPELLEQLELEVSVKELIKKEASQKDGQKTTIHQLPGWFWHASAAATILLVIMIQVFRQPTPTQLHEFVLNEIESFDYETVTTVRSNKEVPTFSDSLFNLALKAAQASSSEKAISLYDELIALSPEQPYLSKSHLNLGIIYYNKGDYNSAITNFSEVTTQKDISRMVEEKAYWFLANALANIDSKEEARTAVGKAYRLQGRYKDPAFKLLRKLDYDLGYIKAESIQ